MYGLTCTGLALARQFAADTLAPLHAYEIDQIRSVLYSNEIHRQKDRSSGNATGRVN
jgi:hypothetical protein